MRSSDHLVRWGGEEFLAVVRFVDRREASDLAEKIRAAIAAHPFRLADGTVLKRTCSIGFGAFPFLPELPRSIGWEEVVDLADLGLYTAKRNGRDRWIGVAAGRMEDPKAALRRFKDDPEGSTAAGEMRVLV
jgi:diguanylate cyclase (GGDEF)-like protein